MASFCSKTVKTSYFNKIAEELQHVEYKHSQQDDENKDDEADSSSQHKVRRAVNPLFFHALSVFLKRSHLLASSQVRV